MNKLTKRLSELRDKSTKVTWTPCSCSFDGPCNNNPGVQIRVCPGDYKSPQLTYNDLVLSCETINALPKLLEIIRIQGEALSNVEQCPIHSLSSCCCQRVAKQALQEVKRIEDE